MGGHQAMCFATRYPQRVRGTVAIATSARLTSQALAFEVVGRNAILRDPDFRDGQYYDAGPRPDVGLAIARMLGHITYLSPEAMQRKFEPDRLEPRDVAGDREKLFSVGSYLAYQGEKFVERFDANSYVTLSRAMDLFDLGADDDEIAEALDPATCRWLVVSFTSDWLFPSGQSRQIVRALLSGHKRVTYCNIDSACGHDAFLLPHDRDRYGRLVEGFLTRLSDAPNARAPDAGPPAENHHPTSIFHSERLDYDRIAELIPPHLSVLDLGCGPGGLLELLSRRAHGRLAGVELDESSVIEAARRGLDVIHADLNEGLPMFGDQQFDVVVLSRTLQAIRHVERVVGEMMRVGRRCIVSFPNFGYYKLREMLHAHGRAPLSGQLHYQWYDSPNIRFLTLADFEDFCAAKDITIHERIALDTEAGREAEGDANRDADLAIFVISGEDA